jgi:hypothetical protein
MYYFKNKLKQLFENVDDRQSFINLADDKKEDYIKDHFKSGKEIPGWLLNDIKNDDNLKQIYFSGIFLYAKNKEIPEWMLSFIKNNDSVKPAYINLLIKNNTIIPKWLLNDIKNDDYLKHAYISELIFNASDIPEWLIPSLTDEQIRRYLSRIINHDKTIPEWAIPSLNTDQFRTYIETLSKTNTEIPEWIISKLSNESKTYYDNFIANPKKLAEEYNKNFHGYFFHTANYAQILYTLKNSKDKMLSPEICVCSFDSERIFRPQYILVGKGNLRMLFDFDCYSGITDDGIHRYATEPVNGIDLEKTKVERIATIGAEIIHSEYHDEGFIKPKDAEFFILSHATKSRNDPEIQKILKNYPELHWMDYKTFMAKLITPQWDKTLPILDKLYYGENIPQDDEKYKLKSRHNNDLDESQLLQEKIQNIFSQLKF